MGPAWLIPQWDWAANPLGVNYVPPVRSHLVDALRAGTLSALRESLRQQMPAGPMRDYFLWGLDPSQPGHRAFVQATGVGQLIRLYAALTHELVDEEAAPKVGELLARIGVYHTYEIVSDNIGIGLFRSPTRGATGNPLDDEPAIAARRQLVRSFNTAMTERLRGGSRTGAVLLSAERRRAARVSMVEHSLAGPTHRRLTAALAGHPGEVEWDLWPVLVANIEAGVRVAATVADTPLGPLVRDGLTERYKGVSRTLSTRHLSRTELAAVGAHTVLVAPTLGYCLAVITHLTEPASGLDAVVADGTLTETLYDAALLSRLLNDAGTELMQLDRAGRHEAVNQLRRESADGELAAALTGPRFTRLAKDLAHGEFNICLYAARRAPSGAAALDALESDLQYFGELYALHGELLRAALDRITARLGDPRPAALIRRFVRFHTDLYAHDYDDPAGEYAI
jgi:hypothetical protein